MRLMVKNNDICGQRNRSTSQEETFWWSIPIPSLFISYYYFRTIFKMIYDAGSFLFFLDRVDLLELYNLLLSSFFINRWFINRYGGRGERISFFKKIYFLGREILLIGWFVFFLFYIWMGYDMIYFSFKNVGKNEWDYKYNSFLWSYIKFWNNRGNFIYWETKGKLNIYFHFLN